MSSYLIVAGKDELENVVEHIASHHNIARVGNPDFHMFVHETLGVDDARLIAERAQGRPYGDALVVIAYIEQATVAAQNALLKTLEEPPARTFVYVVTPYTEQLLPTVTSRTIRFPWSMARTPSEEVFLSLSVGERLEYISKYTDKKSQLNTRESARTFVRNTSSAIVRMRDTLQPTVYKQSQSLLLVAHEELAAPSSSIKQVLEMLAVALPVF